MKTWTLSAVAMVMAGIFTLAGADAGDAFAQDGVFAADGPDAAPGAGSATDSIVMVSREVVQPLPHDADTATTDAEAIAAAEERTGEPLDLRETLAAIDAPTGLSPEMECLAGAVYFEARGEPVEGQLAVARVIVNRSESQMFPPDYCGVVHQRAQFSFVHGGRMPSIRRGSSAWRRARKIAQIAHEGLVDSAVGDALYFHAKYVRPGWSRSKIARGTIARHVFYR